MIGIGKKLKIIVRKTHLSGDINSYFQNNQFIMKEMCKITFGKYKGWYIIELIPEHIGYIKH